MFIYERERLASRVTEWSSRQTFCCIGYTGVQGSHLFKGKGNK